MADLRSASPLADNHNVVTSGNGIAGNTYIVSIATATATVAEAITEATTGDANDNVFTVAGVEGTADGDHIALQGTATPSITGGTVVATFTQD